MAHQGRAESVPEVQESVLEPTEEEEGGNKVSKTGIPTQPTLKQGDRVLVYQDPITCQIPEGWARVGSLINAAPDGAVPALDCYDVRFYQCADYVPRMIKRG